MRKTLNINLGGMAFIIDENAFELLHTYHWTKYNYQHSKFSIGCCGTRQKATFPRPG